MSSNSNSGRRKRLGRAGVTTVEWALVMTTFLFMIFSITDMAWFMIVSQSLTTLMAEAGRQTLVAPNDFPPCTGAPGSWPTGAQITPLLDPNQVYVCVNPYPSSVGPNGDSVAGTIVVDVTVSYPYSATMPWMSVLNGSCLMPDGVTPAICESATYVY
jgi:hypothetical protein